MFPALLVANGFLPYLGAKTETSFAMYSNLRTEGGQTNHWLMPASLQIWDYQRDLVKIHRVSVAQNTAAGEPRVSMDLLRVQMDDARLSERVGCVRAQWRGEASQRVKDDPELMQPDNPLMRKMLKFRPVADWTRPSCIH